MPSEPRVDSSPLSAISLQLHVGSERRREAAQHPFDLARETSQIGVLRLGQQGKITSEKEMILNFTGRAQGKPDER